MIKGHQILTKDRQGILLFILRGSSLHRQQIRTKEEFLKTSVLLKGTSSVK